MALPRVERPVGAAAHRGTAIHRFVRRALVIGRETALAEIADADLRAFCERLDLSSVFDLGRVVSSEMAYAYAIDTDTCRELGDNRGRDYGSLAADEVPGTTDLVLAKNETRIVADVKTGQPHVERERAQLRVNGLMVGRAEHVETVRTIIVRIDEEADVRIEPLGTLDSWALDEVRYDVRVARDRILAARRVVAAGGVPDVRMGEACVWCPAKPSCPGHVALARELASDARKKDEVRHGVAAMFPDEAGLAWARLERAEEVLKLIREALVERLKDEGSFPMPDGREVYLNEQWPEGVDVAKAVAYDPTLRLLVEETITKAALEKRYGAETKKTEATYAALRAAGVLVTGENPRLVPMTRKRKLAVLPGGRRGAA